MIFIVMVAFDVIWTGCVVTLNVQTFAFLYLRATAVLVATAVTMLIEMMVAKYPRDSSHVNRDEICEITI